MLGLNSVDVNANCIVVYVEECEPKVRAFEMLVECESFVSEFLLMNQGNDDSFINLITAFGEIYYVDNLTTGGDATSIRSEHD